MEEEQCNYEFVNMWFDQCFKPKMKDFLISFSSKRQIRRKHTRILLLHYLQIAGKKEDLEEMSYLREKLKKADAEDSQGIVIRSRHQESLESERLSLFHLNREMKKGKTRSLDRISVKIGEEKVIIEDKKIIHDSTVSFFSSLFQGYHLEGETFGDTPFEPDFSNLLTYLEGIGEMNEEEAEEMIAEITLEEVEEAV